MLPGKRSGELYGISEEQRRGADTIPRAESEWEEVSPRAETQAWQLSGLRHRIIDVAVAAS